MAFLDLFLHDPSEETAAPVAFPFRYALLHLTVAQLVTLDQVCHLVGAIRPA